MQRRSSETFTKDESNFTETTDAKDSKNFSKTSSNETGKFQNYNELITHLLGLQKLGNDGEIRLAFYMGLVLTIFALGSYLIYAVFTYALSIFLRCLIWALLLGTALYPVKYLMASTAHSWLESIHHSGRSFTGSCLVLPFSMFDFTLDTIGSITWSLLLEFKWPIIGLNLAIAIYANFDALLPYLIFGNYVFMVLNYVMNLMKVVAEQKWAWSVFVGFIVAISFFWGPENKSVFNLISIPVWLVAFFHFSAYFGNYVNPMLVVGCIMLATGFWTELRAVSRRRSRTNSSDENEECGEQTPNKDQVDQKIQKASALDILSASWSHLINDSLVLDYGYGGSTLESEAAGEPTDGISLNKQKQSTKILIVLCWVVAFFAVFVSVGSLFIFILPVAYYHLRKCGVRLGLWKLFCEKLDYIGELFQDWYNPRREALTPAPIRGIFKLMKFGDRRLIKILMNQIDSGVTVVTLVGVLFLVITSSFFVAWQIKRETVKLVSVSESFVSQTLERHPEIYQAVGDGWKTAKSVEDMAASFYMNNREWIKVKIKEYLGGDSKDSSVEDEILHLLDSLYVNLFSNAEKHINSTSEGPTNVRIIDTGGVIPHEPSHNDKDRRHNLIYWYQIKHRTSNDILEDLKRLAGNIYEMKFGGDGDESGEGMNLFGLDLSIIRKVFDTITMIITTNISLFFYIIWQFLSILLMYSTVLINFIVQLVVFLSCIYYVLAMSKKNYAPVSAVNRFASVFVDGEVAGAIVQEAISSLFYAAFKLAAFYALYTWLTHTIFDIEVKFLPAVFAALFAAIPLVSSYWICIPGCLDLIVREHYALAVLLFVSHYLPTMLVDPIIYSEIKSSGHPYLFALSVFGGVTTIGLEGAFVGPMLLCAVVIVFDLYSNYISPKYLRKHSVSNSTTEFSVPGAQQDLDECSSFNLAKYRMKTPLATSTPSRESFVPNQKIMSEIRRRNEKNIEDVLSPINSPENSTSNE